MRRGPPRDELRRDRATVSWALDRSRGSECPRRLIRLGAFARRIEKKIHACGGLGSETSSGDARFSINYKFGEPQILMACGRATDMPRFSKSPRSSRS
jgi:hypothetical protein